MNPIKIIVHGALGRMGQEVIKTVCQEGDLQLVGAVDSQFSNDQLVLPDGSGNVPAATNMTDILSKYQPDVLVDFSTAAATMPAVRIAARSKINLVIGTTGLSKDDISEIEQLSEAQGIGVVVAPNFALGAALMIHLSKIAATYFDYAEIIELHHHQKIDSPSGTALSTARVMAEARGKQFSQPPGQPSGSRGATVEGISIHSVRLPGLQAHQEVILGTAGQTLRIRHDMISRESFMPGVILAIRDVVKRQGLIQGMETLLKL